jgi:hypothetical protein
VRASQRPGGPRSAGAELRSRWLGGNSPSHDVPAGAAGARHFAAGTLVALLACAGAPALAAQQPEAISPAPAQTQLAPAIGVSPRGAFLRALAIPGWGHAAIGSHVRGGFYFGVEAATAYTLVRSRRRLVEVRERVGLRETLLRDQLAAQGVEDPEEIDTVLDADPALSELRRLEESRADQQEDMVALGIFLLFLSGADAYVSAHLSRFPSPLELEADPVGDGRVELSLRLALPR